MTQGSNFSMPDTFPKISNLMIITFVWSHSLVVSLHWWLPVMKVGVCYTAQYLAIFLLQLHCCINSSKQFRQMKIVDCVVLIEKLHLGTTLKYPWTQQIVQNIHQMRKKLFQQMCLQNPNSKLKQNNLEFFIKRVMGTRQYENRVERAERTNTTVTSANSALSFCSNSLLIGFLSNSHYSSPQSK